MLRQFRKTLEPIRIKLFRAASEGGSADAGADTSVGNSAFSRNSISKEQQLSTALRRSLPGITYVSVQDISGGCGAMFEVSVEATEFAGLSRVKQHRLVTNSLKNEIAEMHGIRIHTTPTPAVDK